jgi:hypothetical protein
MKPQPKKSVTIAVVLSVAVIAGITLAQAQETAGNTTPSSNDSIVALAADSQSLPQVTANQVPTRDGTFWWVYPGGIAVPTPMLPFDSGAPIYSISSSSQEYLVDLTGSTVLVTPYQLKQAAQVATSPYAAAVTAQVQGLINLITMVQNPPATTTATAMTLSAKPMGGGFSPMDQTQSGVPYLTIAPTNGMFLLTVWNDQGPTNYEIWTTPVLVNPTWTLVTNGPTGQTNFIVNTGPFSTGFYRALIDDNSIPIWEMADPNNPSAGILTVFIDSPSNGAIIQ